MGEHTRMLDPAKEPDAGEVTRWNRIAEQRSLG